MTIIYLDKVEISDGLNDFKYSSRTTCHISFLLNNTLTMTDVVKVQKHVLDYNNLYFLKNFDHKLRHLQS